MTASTSACATTVSKSAAGSQAAARPETAAARAGSRSQANRSRTPGTLARATARFLPISPQPTMAKDSGLLAGVGAFMQDAFAGEGAPRK